MRCYKRRLRGGSIVLFVLTAIVALSSCVTAPQWVPVEKRTMGAYPGEHWSKAASPEEMGWSSEKLAEAKAFSERIGTAAMMIVEDGTVVDAWGDVTRNFKCHSMRKPLMSALIGIHVEEGDIDLSQTMKELGIDDVEPSLSPVEKKATVRDLISARSGIYHPALGEASMMKAARPKRHSKAPGAFYYYNNWDFNAVGTIFEQQTGTQIFEEFDRRIAKPLQMEDFSVDNCHYATGPESIHRYYGIRMSARDLARFGLLYLRNGRWKDNQIVPADWVEESTRNHSILSPSRGYGYMWATGIGKGFLTQNVRFKGRFFYHGGLGMHYLIVYPRRKLVIVHRVNTDVDRRRPEPWQIERLIWHILDAAGETDIGDCPVYLKAHGRRLEGKDLAETISGCTLKGTSANSLVEDGSRPYIMTFDPDGSFVVRSDGTEEDSGKWWACTDKLWLQFKKRFDGRKVFMYAILDETSLKVYSPYDGTCISRLKYEKN